MKTLFVAWQDSESRQWHPIGRLDRLRDGFCFRYTLAAYELKGFRPFGGLPDKKSKYFSESLFPIFENRTLPKSRPEYKNYLSWLGIESSQDDLMLELSRSFGAKITDTIEIFPLPEKTADGQYEIYFFSKGHRYFSQDDDATKEALEESRKLFLMADLQNHADEHALLLRTGDPVSLVGYIPRYFSEDTSKLIKMNGINNIEVSIERVNYNAPTQYRYLCKLSTLWPEDFQPFSSEKFLPLVE